MAGHDEYGKRVLTYATKGAAVLSGPSVETHHGAGSACRIDATYGYVAIEVEARVGKQVRGAVFDLILHAHPKKLLVLIPANMDVSVEEIRCSNILRKFCAANLFKVVCLKGRGDSPCLEEDAAAVADTLCGLRADLPN